MNASIPTSLVVVRLKATLREPSSSDLKLALREAPASFDLKSKPALCEAPAPASFDLKLALREASASDGTRREERNVEKEWMNVKENN